MKENRSLLERLKRISFALVSSLTMVVGLVVGGAGAASAASSTIDIAGKITTPDGYSGDSVSSVNVYQIYKDEYDEDYEELGGVVASTENILSSGLYEITSFDYEDDYADGTEFVVSSSGSNSNVLPERFYTQSGASASEWQDATRLVVQDGKLEANNVDIELVEGDYGVIGGKVTSNGTPLNGELRVSATSYDEEGGWEDEYTANVDAQSGEYEFKGIYDGKYALYFYQEEPGYDDYGEQLPYLRSQWYNGVTSESASQPVVVSEQTRRHDNINFTTSAATAPGKPGVPTVVSKTARSVKVRVKAPTDDGGRYVWGQTVSANNGRSCETGEYDDEDYCTISGLTPGSAYTFTARASNAVGLGAASNKTASVRLPKLNQTLAKTKTSMKRKKTLKLPRTTGQKRAVKWTSLSKKICTVNSKGVVKAKKRKGTCKLRATATANAQYNALRVNRDVKVR